MQLRKRLLPDIPNTLAVCGLNPGVKNYTRRLRLWIVVSESSTALMCRPPRTLLYLGRRDVRPGSYGRENERCVAILARCREAMAPTRVLFVIEMVLPEGNEPCFGKWLDLDAGTHYGAIPYVIANWRLQPDTSDFDTSSVEYCRSPTSVTEQRLLST